MADGTHIEWTDATWNPITGCTVVSPGCTNCYAMRLAGTRLKHHPSRAGLTVDTKAGPVWNGKVRLNREWLAQPLSWKRPRMIFVCAHGDLFHEDVPDEWIDRVFAVMALAPHHTFQVLTKRADRMRAYVSGIQSKIPFLGRMPLERIHLEAAGHMKGDGGFMDVLKDHGNVYSLYLDAPWPLPNVWLGVSVEDQSRADQRRASMAPLADMGWLTWVSYEPALGPVDWKGWEFARWIVSGGESGDGARPTHPEWHRATRDFCAAHEISFLFKQWGAWAAVYDRDVEDPDWRQCGAVERSTPRGRWMNLLGGHGFHGDRVIRVDRIGKKRAGRLLDGVEHNGMPKV